MSDAVDVRDLSRRFGDFTAVDRVSFQVAPGEIFGFLGANGAGKSTTIRMLCGLLLPSSGSASVIGHDVRRHPERVKRAIGYMSQRFSLYTDLTGWENIDFFGGVYGLPPRRRAARGHETLALVGMQKEAKRMVRTLPGGYRQRLALACALLHEPEIVFLDEPTAGVDPNARLLFWSIIHQLSQQGTTVFVTTHYMEEAEFCRRIGLMVKGRLVALDTPAALKKTYIRGTLYAVHGHPLQTAAPRLSEIAGVHKVEPFGSGLHVTVDPGRISAQQLQTSLHAAGVSGIRIRQVEPSLEDVFLQVVGANAEEEA